MILLPIGHDESGVRRLPWMTFGVMILCVLAFLVSGRAQLFSPDDVRIAERMQEAFNYYVAHPYLELDEEFRGLAFGDAPEEAGADLLEMFQEALPGTPANPLEIHQQQQELDRLIARAMDSLEAHPLLRWGLVPAEPSARTLVSHMFLHAGWLHLVGNLLILYLAGPFIEDVWGRPLYAAFYIVSGIVAALAYVGFNGESTVPMIGASGAIAGVMGAFLVRYSRTRIRFFYMVGLFIRGTFAAPAWIMLPFWFGVQVFFMLLTRNLANGGGVAYWAHIGGFAFGAVAAVAIQQYRVEERFIHPKIEGKILRPLVDKRVVELAMQAREQGQPDRAFRLLMAESRRDPADHDLTLALWTVAAELGRCPEAAPALLRTIGDELGSGETELALRHWNELSEWAPSAPLSCARLVHVARALDDAGHRDPARMALRRALAAAATAPDSGSLMAIALAGEAVDPAVAAGAARLALARPDLDPAGRAAAERILAASALASEALPVAPAP